MLNYKIGLMMSTGERMDAVFTNGTIYGGFHCGECFQVKIKNKWVEVRIEYGDDWYLIGENDKRVNIPTLIGLPIRIQEGWY